MRHMSKSKSYLPLDYITIKTTKSRIDKGLLAIPVSLTDYFSKDKKQICLIDERGRETLHNFTPYASSSRECRIGGLHKFYRRFKIQNNDELVLIFEDKDRIKLLPESFFKQWLESAFLKLENAKSKNLFENTLQKICNFTTLDKSEFLKNKFIQSIDLPLQKRNKIMKKASINENVPYGVRKILASVYDGKCQLSGWTFLMKNNKPYFEVHHIDENLGHHFKKFISSESKYSRTTYLRKF